MADYFFTDNGESGLHRRDWLKLAGMFALYSILMLALMGLAVYLAAPR
jgi:hypothetical protein